MTVLIRLSSRRISVTSSTAIGRRVMAMLSVGCTPAQQDCGGVNGQVPRRPSHHQQSHDGVQPVHGLCPGPNEVVAVLSEELEQRAESKVTRSEIRGESDVA